MKIINRIEKSLEKYIISPTNKPIEIIIHHVGGTDKDPLADTSNHTFEIVRSYHKSKGWDTIGYHFFIEKTGDIYQGRPIEMHGAHVTGRNKDTIGICLAGNFDAKTPTIAQMKSLQELVTDLQKKTGINTIAPHRKYAKKTCPGKNFTDAMVQDLIHPVSECSIGSFSNKELLDELAKRLK